MTRPMTAAAAALLFLSASCPAIAQDDSQARLAIAERLVAETITAGFVENMTQTLWTPLEASLREKNPDISGAAIAALKADLAEQQKLLIAELVVDLPAIYARHFTAGELQTIYDFQASDLGRKTVALQPQIMAEIMPKIIRSLQEQTPVIMERFRQRALEKGYRL